MVKKIKKPPRSGHKDKRCCTHNEEKISENTETVEHNTIKKARTGCPHLDKGIELAKVTSKLLSVEHIRCEDCKENVIDKRVNKGKEKTDSESSKATWICLQCGHISCGGIGSSTISQSHAIRHANQSRHYLAIQYENPQLRWCFPCATLILVEKISDEGGFDDTLSDIVKLFKDRSTKKVSVIVDDPLSGIVKLVKGRSTEKISVDNPLSDTVELFKARPTKKNSMIIEDVCFWDYGIFSEKKVENTGYLVRGLANLGNTCFFNSIMQNLLALNRLRDHYLALNKFAGPLNVSVKKLFRETVSESGLKYLVNPKPLFDSVCAKAPQFRGFQQHDSHELLRFLLDRLCTEEAEKRISHGSTFIDSVFGGQLSSTVSCLECGHSSKVLESFLDLSIPLPTKKSLTIHAGEKYHGVEGLGSITQSLDFTVTTTGSSVDLTELNEAVKSHETVSEFDNICADVGEEEEVFSSAIGCEPYLLDFGFLLGLGPVGTSVKPIASESDPEEIDNSNSQVSVESCLAHFTKSELLSASEHGWICENCSEAIEKHKRQSEKTREKAADEIEQKEAVDRFNNRLSGSDQDSLCLSIVQNTNCGDLTTEIYSLKVDDDYTTSEKIVPVSEESKTQDLIGHIPFPVEENIGGVSSDVCNANEVHMLQRGFESDQSGDEEMNHESTKVKRDATKRILINNVPSILTIHLNRFSQDARGRLSKLNGHVDFNDTLDLRPYMDDRSNAMEDCMYRLSGVVEHRGMMTSGHYVAYIRGSNKSQTGDKSVWYHANDDSVHQVSLQEVLQCDAYILFYEKV